MRLWCCQRQNANGDVLQIKVILEYIPFCSLTISSFLIWTELCIIQFEVRLDDIGFERRWYGNLTKTISHYKDKLITIYGFTKKMVKRYRQIFSEAAAGTWNGSTYWIFIRACKGVISNSQSGMKTEDFFLLRTNFNRENATQ